MGYVPLILFSWAFLVLVPSLSPGYSWSPGSVLLLLFLVWKAPLKVRRAHFKHGSYYWSLSKNPWGKPFWKKNVGLRAWSLFLLSRIVCLFLSPIVQKAAVDTGRSGLDVSFVPRSFGGILCENSQNDCWKDSSREKTPRWVAGTTYWEGNRMF